MAKKDPKASLKIDEQVNALGLHILNLSIIGYRLLYVWMLKSIKLSRFFANRNIQIQTNK